MKFLGKITVAIFLFTGIFFGIKKEVAFAAACDATYPANVSATASHLVRVELPISSGVQPNTIALCGQDAVLNPDANDPAGKYCFRISACNANMSGAGGCSADSWFMPSGQRISSDGKFIELNWTYDKSYQFKLESNDLRNGSGLPLGSTRIKACSSTWGVTVQREPAYCDGSAFVVNKKAGTSPSEYIVSFNGQQTHNFRGGQYKLFIEPYGGSGRLLANLGSGGDGLVIQPGNAQQYDIPLGVLAPGDWTFVITGSLEGERYCDKSFKVDVDDVVEQPGGTGANEIVAFRLCDQAANEDDKAECRKCVSSGDITNPSDSSQKFWTAFGCVSTTKEGIVSSFLRIGLGIAGGFVLLSILYGAFLLTTSSGDPKRVQEGQEMISSAVMGLLFVIFSVIILQFIGVSLLRIPGFGT